MGLGTPLLCSDIVENRFITGENATHFISGDSNSLAEKINYCLDSPEKVRQLAKDGKTDILARFNWDSVASQYMELFNRKK
jgi:glycosyltransferase involved in cell wall biosynthesis